MARNANTKDEKIDVLQHEIDQLRRVVLSMLPMRLHALLQESPRYVRTLSQRYRWRRAMVDQIIEMIETPGPEQDYVVCRDCHQLPTMWPETEFVLRHRVHFVASMLSIFAASWVLLRAWAIPHTTVASARPLRKASRNSYWLLDRNLPDAPCE